MTNRACCDGVGTQEVARLKQKEVERQTHSSVSRRRRANRDHVIDRVLTLSCPRCGQAFFDFDGCVALMCSRDNAAFCAYCLKDCGTDAHRHVVNCEHNPTPDKNLFPGLEVFEDAQRQRLLTQLSVEDRENLLLDCEAELRDLGIDPNQLSERY